MTDPLVLHVEPVLRNAPLVLAFEGWNDAGEAATHALDYIADAIRSVPLAEIDSEEFLDFTVTRPNVRLDAMRERVIDWPHTKFRYGSADVSREVVTARGMEPHFRWRRYCEIVASLVKRLGVGEVVLLGAYLADVVYSRPVGVTGFSSDPGRLEQLGVTQSDYEGPTGIVGVLSERLRRDGVSVVSLWAGLPHYITATPNPRGALALVQKLIECLGLKLDVEPLRSAAARFEGEISALVSGDPELNEYVRRLKRREFAQ